MPDIVQLLYVFGPRDDDPPDKVYREGSFRDSIVGLELARALRDEVTGRFILRDGPNGLEPVD